MTVRATAASLQGWPTGTDPVIAYAEWRMSCTSVWGAYGDWLNAPKEDADLAHAAYTAALDREDAAAHAYSALIKVRPARHPGAGEAPEEGAHWNDPVNG